ncbi:Uncharacterised protein [Mycobacteroides abscessus]|nr:Uncharacterised protein [Mycobacteroides abscessus]CRG59457.1 Uncharacterised protein [Mycobacteroides abscessus]
MDKQPALDADEVFTIVSHFDRLDVADAEAALRAAAELAGCPVGVRWSDATEPTVWLEREGPARATDELLLHRLRHLLNRLNRAVPAQGATSLRIDDPALIELLLSGEAKPEERARAARLLGLDATRELRVLATSSPGSATRLLAKALPGQSIRTATIGRVGAVLCQSARDTTSLSDHLNEVIVDEFSGLGALGAGPMAWHRGECRRPRGIHIMEPGPAGTALRLVHGFRSPRHCLRAAQSAGGPRRYSGGARARD